MKRIKNIEDKHEEPLKALTNQGNKQLNAINDISINSKKLKLFDAFSKISPEAEKLISKIKEEQNAIDFKKLYGSQ